MGAGVAMPLIPSLGAEGGGSPSQMKPCVKHRKCGGGSLPIIPASEDRRECLRANWLARLAISVSSGLLDKPCLKEEGGRGTDRPPSHTHRIKSIRLYAL